jgi:CubicO group peptidase (beta-lactamase class C family)
MKKLSYHSGYVIILCLSFSCLINAQSKYPVKGWDNALPEKYGYNSAKLKVVNQYIIDSMKTTGLVVVVGGEIIFSYGNTQSISYLASCRKSLLAMLYGKYVENGTIDLNKTVTELGFDDVGGLLPIEKTAKVYDLITARSGVYHLGSNEGDDRTSAPPRGSKVPGEYFLYNNWDFNVAGAAFEKMTGYNIYDAFQTDIAVPIGMEDFNRQAQTKGYDSDTSISRFPSYHFYLSTRDMARVGYLMLRKGNWNGEQIISSEWVKKITSVVTPIYEMNPLSRRNAEFGFGYMWWIFQGKANSDAFKDAYTARGAYGQYITILPSLDMVVAHKTDAIFERKTTWETYYRLLHLIIAAKAI